MTKRYAAVILGSVLIVILGAVGYAINASQERARTDVERRFHERAAVTASVLGSTFSSTLTSAAAQARALARKPTTGAALSEGEFDGPLATNIVIDRTGRILAARPSALRRLVSRVDVTQPHVRDAFAGHTAVSGVLEDTIAGGLARIELAAPVDDERTLLTGFPVAMASGFLVGYLNEGPGVEGEGGAVIDTQGNVLGVSPSDLPDVDTLVRSGTHSDHGEATLGGTTYTLTAHPIKGTPYRIVLAAPKDALYGELGDTGKWLPWALLVLLTGLGAFSLELIRRAVRRGAEVEALNYDLELRNHEVERADRAKSEFLAGVSHELRTPLNGIIGFAELLRDGRVGEVSEVHREFLGDILTSSRHLLGLINDLLDLSKVESGHFHFDPEPVDIAALVSEVRDGLRSLADDREVLVTLELVELDGVVLDPHRLRQVLYNLLSNALKHSEAGDTVTVALTAEGGARIRIEVRDEGAGIAPEDLERLFTEFTQVGDDAARRRAGTGLGLALTRRLVEAQGGEVGVESELGAGSRFWIVLPRTSGRPAAPSPLTPEVITA